MNHLRLMNWKSKGFTLIQTLLVLAIVSAAGAGTFYTYKNYQQREQAQQSVTATRLMTNNLMQTYGQSGSFKSLNTKSIITGNLNPTTLKSDGGALWSSWGGQVDLAPSDATNRAFTMTWTKIPSGVCSNMSAALARDYPEVKINQAVLKSDTVAFNPGTAAQMCGTSEQNTLVLTSPSISMSATDGEVAMPANNSNTALLPPTAPPALAVPSLSPISQAPSLLAALPAPSTYTVPLAASAAAP